MQTAVLLLPTPVQEQGIVVKTASSSLLQVYGLHTTNSEFDATFISNYMDLYVNDEIARVLGAGQPKCLDSRSVTVDEYDLALIEAIEQRADQGSYSLERFKFIPL